MLTKGGMFATKTDTSPDQPTVEEVFSKLNKIRDEKDTARGHCLSCACETAVVLQKPQSYVPKVINASNCVTDEENAKSAFGEELKTKTFEPTDEHMVKLLKYLNEKAAPGSVFIADTDDHVYVLFKSYKNQIYLLDSDSHVYNQVNSPDDFKAPIEMVKNVNDHDYIELKEEGFYNYFFDVEHTEDNEGGLELTLIGLAHPSWDNILEPFEKPKKAPPLSMGEEKEAVTKKEPQKGL